MKGWISRRNRHLSAFSWWKMIALSGLSSSVDVVVTDAVMPNLSGQELARFLRSNQRLSHVPIVLLTGQENKEAVGSEANAINAFLYKPVRAEELKSCLAGLLRQDQ